MPLSSICFSSAVICLAYSLLVFLCSQTPPVSPAIVFPIRSKNISLILSVSSRTSLMPIFNDRPDGVLFNTLPILSFVGRGFDDPLTPQTLQPLLPRMCCCNHRYVSSVEEISFYLPPPVSMPARHILKTRSESGTGYIFSKSSFSTSVQLPKKP